MALGTLNAKIGKTFCLLICFVYPTKDVQIEPLGRKGIQYTFERSNDLAMIPNS